METPAPKGSGQVQCSIVVRNRVGERLIEITMSGEDQAEALGKAIGLARVAHEGMPSHQDMMVRGVRRLRAAMGRREEAWAGMEPNEPVNTCGPDADAARRFAMQIERLRAGLAERGIKPRPGQWPEPIDSWPVTAALEELDRLSGREPQPQSRKAIVVGPEIRGHPSAPNRVASRVFGGAGTNGDSSSGGVGLAGLFRAKGVAIEQSNCPSLANHAPHAWRMPEVVVGFDGGFGQLVECPGVQTVAPSAVGMAGYSSTPAIPPQATENSEPVSGQPAGSTDEAQE